MKRQKFDLDTAKKIMSGEIKGSVVTGEGHKVELLERQLKGERPVMGIVDFGDYEFTKQWTTEGKSNPKRLNTPSVYDLEILIEE